MSMNVQRNFSNKGNKIDFNLPVIKFEEESLFFIYSPALDLTGYGKTEGEAQSSFEETLSQFLNYTTNKKTLVSELKKLGWEVSRIKLVSPLSLKCSRQTII